MPGNYVLFQDTMATMAFANQNPALYPEKILKLSNLKGSW